MVKAEDIQVRFPRDENGNIDAQNGKYSDITEKVIWAKYTDEVHLCIGVVIVRIPYKSREGQICDLTDYTRRVIVYLEEEPARIQTEVDHVRSLTGKRAS